MTVLAFDTYATNAELIEACVKLGYLRKEWWTLDPTYGNGTFWKNWKPDFLDASDLDPAKSPHGIGISFTDLPYLDKTFDAVVFDPPYKLNGTPDKKVDKRYGVHEPTQWRERLRLCRDGLTECARVTKPGGYVLMKCQDQVCSGRVRWQTIDFATHGAINCRLELVDRLDKLGSRPQPEGRRQVHARRNSSTMLVFKRG